MLAYLYDENTKEYKGYTEAQTDPLESELQGKDIYLLPANATFKEPIKEKDSFARVWNGTAWVNVLDTRGKRYVMKDLKTVFINESLGEVDAYLVSDELWAEYTTGKRKEFALNSQGKLVVIQKEATIQEQINELELSITARNIRAAFAGDEIALQKIKDVESQIEELRKQL